MNRLAAWLAVALLAGCASVEPRDDPQAIARGAGLARAEIDAPPFRLAAWSRVSEPGAPLRIYIEGDGRAWLTRQQRSDDPTPRNAIGLRLASADMSPNVAYLARPCQYV